MNQQGGCDLGTIYGIPSLHSHSDEQGDGDTWNFQAEVSLVVQKRMVYKQAARLIWGTVALSGI
jgi:hypothetical protein